MHHASRENCVSDRKRSRSDSIGAVAKFAKTSSRTSRLVLSPDSSKIDEIREPVSFTGGLLLAQDFIREMYVHMGFHPAYKYRVVHELVFDAGQLIEEHDRSAEMAEYREMLSSKSLEPADTASMAEIDKWIDRCFSLEYKGFRGQNRGSNHSG